MVEFSRPPTLEHLESLRKTEMLFVKSATSPQTFSAGFCLFVSFHYLKKHLICNCTLFLSGCELVYYCTTTCQVNEKILFTPFQPCNQSRIRGIFVIFSNYVVQPKLKITSHSITFSSTCYLIKSYQANKLKRNRHSILFNILARKLG